MPRQNLMVFLTAQAPLSPLATGFVQIVLHLYKGGKALGGAIRVEAPYFFQAEHQPYEQSAEHSIIIAIDQLAFLRKR